MPTTVTTSGGSTTVTSTGPSYSVKTVVASPSGAKVVVSSSGGATAAAASAPQLSANAAVLSAEELTYAESLVAAGQAHLFAGWPAPGEMDAEKKGLIQQLMESDSLYGGGIPQYVENARVLLAASQSGTNPLEGYSPSLADGVTLTAHTDEWAASEAAGLEAVAKCAFMLVAGGLGERLGYSGIKIALPTETSSERCYLDHYISTILACVAFSTRRMSAST
jgi:UDP-sugar pyrophosphorylase